MLKNHSLGNYLFLLIISLSTILPEISLFLAILLFLLWYENYDWKIKYIDTIPFLLFFLCFLVTISHIAYDLNDIFNKTSIYRTRKFFIEITVCYLCYPFLRNMMTDNLKYLAGLFLTLHLLIILLQHMFNFENKSSTFIEPSALATFAILFSVIYLAKSEIISTVKVLFLAFLLGSKAFILGLFLRLIMYSKSVNIFFLVPFISILFYFLSKQETFSNAINGFVVFFSAISSAGLNGLDMNYGVYATYLTRISSLVMSINAIVDLPFGLGFGNFHHYYLDQHLSVFYENNLGDEVNESLQSGLVTPKSQILEIIVSGGVLTMCLILYWVYFFIRKNIRNTIIIFPVLFVALVTELSNFYLILLIMSIYFNDESHKSLKSN